MSHDRNELREIEALCRRILTDAAGADQQHAPALDRDAWTRLESAGLTDLAAGLDGDAPGAGLHRAFAVLREAGRHTNAVPIAENDLLASSIAARSGLDLEPGVLRAAAILDDGGTGTTSWLGEVDVVLVVGSAAGGGSVVWEAPVSAVKVEHERPQDAESSSRIRVEAPDAAVTLDEDIRPGIVLLGALARSVLMASAAERVVELVVEHVTTREQFGRPISKFQAVQHLLADLASEASLMAAVAEAAVEAVAEHGTTDPASEFAVAAAASCAGHAAAPVARHAHQLLGAMGYTQEHQLRIFTTRLLRWRSEFGSLKTWDDRVLAAAVEAGPGGLWPLVAGQ